MDEDEFKDVCTSLPSKYEQLKRDVSFRDRAEKMRDAVYESLSDTSCSDMGMSLNTLADYAHRTVTGVGCASIFHPQLLLCLNFLRPPINTNAKIIECNHAINQMRMWMLLLSKEHNQECKLGFFIEGPEGVEGVPYVTSEGEEERMGVRLGIGDKSFTEGDISKHVGLSSAAATGISSDCYSYVFPGRNLRRLYSAFENAADVKPHDSELVEDVFRAEKRLYAKILSFVSEPNNIAVVLGDYHHESALRTFALEDDISSATVMPSLFRIRYTV